MWNDLPMWSGRSGFGCASVLLATAGLALAACGGAEPEPRAPASAAVAPPLPPATSTSASSGTPSGSAVPREKRDTANAAPPKVATAPIPLPSVPPRPVTIPLVPASEEGDYAAKVRDGDEAFEKNAIGVAEKAYEAARKLAPKRAAAAVGLARVKIAKSNVPLEFGAGKKLPAVQQAAAELARLVAIPTEKDNGAAIAELGRAQLLLGDSEKVVATLRRAGELLPDHAEVQSSLGIALLATGRTEEAVPAFRAAATLDKGSAVRHSHYGTALLMRGQVKQAIEEYELAARIDDGDARAHSDLGTALLADNQLERAIAELERAISIDPKRATFRSNMGYAQQLLGKREKAIEHYREAIKLDDKLASAWINLATALAQEPKTRVEARAALQRARAIDPTDPRVIANLKELDELERSKK